jgi:LysR family transcriptional regulator, transcriptional activator of the cysJI operon
MNIHYLKSFVTVVECCSFSKAAKKLHLSQPSITSHIQNLEKEVGFRLIDRGKNHLTFEGKRFLEFADSVLREYYAMKEDYHKLSAAIRGTLNIVSSTVIAEFLLPKIIEKFRNQNPFFQVKTEILDPSQVACEVHKGDKLIGFCGIKENNYDIESIKIGEDEQVLVVSPKHRLANRKEIIISDLIGETLLLRSEPHWINKFYPMLKARFEEDNYQPKLIMGTITGLISSVESNLGIGIVSNLAIRSQEKSGLVKVIKFKNIHLKQDLFCIYKRDDRSDPFLCNFLDFLASNIDKNKNILAFVD